jgi:hypothetical protein
MFFTRVISLGPNNAVLSINGKVWDGEKAKRAKLEALEIEDAIIRGSR